MRAPLALRLQQALNRRARAAETRMQIVRAGAPHDVHVDGRPLVNFSSNDYLGLANHPRVIEAATQAMQKYGVGSGASAAISGYTHAHEELEHTIVNFLGCESAMLFSTGYMANLAVVSVLAGRGMSVYEDRLNHASLLDAAVLARAQLRRYRHADIGSLTDMLAAHNDEAKLVVTDGVFSMDGDVAPLAELARLCDQTGVGFMVDDAHGLGVMGATGRGSFEYCGVNLGAADVLVGTFGKSLGVAGAFVAGSRLLIESLRQFARPHLYTTAMPPALAAAITTGLRIIDAQPNLRATLHDNIAYFKECARAARIPWTDSVTPIQPVPLGDNATVVRVGDALREQGFWVGAIRPPTVPVGTARLRITLSAAHQREHIDGLVAALRALL